MGTDDLIMLGSEAELMIQQRKLECFENDTENYAQDELFCNTTFDGWSCWPKTFAGKTAYISCPDFIPGFDRTRNAFKTCTIDGTWYNHPISGNPWSNYTTCVNYEELRWRQSTILIHEIGYTISLVALLVSLFLFFYLKTIRCARITLHINLFISFTCNNILWIIWYRFVVINPDVTINNYVWCWVLHVILYYFLLSNYTWMLCEGIYLHTILVNTFFSEFKLLKWLIGLGWGCPVIWMTFYVAFRTSNLANIKECWMQDSPYKIFLIVPVCITMGLNFVFLCNIIRVVLIKLKYGEQLRIKHGSTRNVLQAFRATLVLVPLLGIQYFLTPFRPAKGHAFEVFYEYMLAFTASLQGLFVSILFCFCNSEISSLLLITLSLITFSWENVFEQYLKCSTLFFGGLIFITSILRIASIKKTVNNSLFLSAIAASWIFLLCAVADLLATILIYIKTVDTSNLILYMTIVLKCVISLLSAIQIANLVCMEKQVAKDNNSGVIVTKSVMYLNDF